MTNIMCIFENNGINKIDVSKPEKNEDRRLVEISFIRELALEDLNNFFSTNNNFQNLKKISFEGGNLINDVFKIPNITSLNLNYCVITNEVALKSLSSVKNLQELSLKYADIDDEQIKGVSSLTSLTKLDLYFCKKITDEALEYFNPLINLQELILCSCNITDTGIKHLSNLTNLEVLSLQLCKKVTCLGMAILANSNPTLTIKHKDWNKK